MSLRVGYFPHNNSLWVPATAASWTCHPRRGMGGPAQPPRGDRPAPTEGCPSAHGDHLSTAATTSSAPAPHRQSPPASGQGARHRLRRDLRLPGTRTAGWSCWKTRRSAPRGPEGQAGRARARLLADHAAAVRARRPGLDWKDIVPVDAGTAAGARCSTARWTPGSAPTRAHAGRVATSARELVATDGLFSHRSLWFTRRDFAAGAARRAGRDRRRPSGVRPPGSRRTTARRRPVRGRRRRRPRRWENALRTRAWGPARRPRSSSPSSSAPPTSSTPTVSSTARSPSRTPARPRSATWWPATISDPGHADALSPRRFSRCWRNDEERRSPCRYPTPPCASWAS